MKLNRLIAILLLMESRGNINANELARALEVSKRTIHPEEFLSNQKTGNKRFLEKALSEAFEGYRKEYIRVERFLPHIRTAIANEKKVIIVIQEIADEVVIWAV